MEKEALFRAMVNDVSRELKILPDKPEETPDNTLRALWFLAAGTPRSFDPKICDDPLPDLNNEAINHLKELIKQRLSGIPLAHLTGRQQFMGLEFLVGSEALIPRKETEILGRSVIDLLKNVVKQRGKAIVVDVCTGSGNLALSFSYYEPGAQVYASDLSNDAVQLARKNAIHLGLDNRVEFREGDLLEPFKDDFFIGNVDLLICNPPYISSKKLDAMPEEIIQFEPRLAFDGGGFGVKILFHLIKDAPIFLKEGGWLCFEVGLGQGQSMIKRVESNGHYRKICSSCDDNGNIRVIMAQIPES